MAILIKKAKMTTSGQLEATYNDEAGNEIVFRGKHKCHADLRAAFENLVPYLADITEQREAENLDFGALDTVEARESLRYLDVTGFALSTDYDLVTLVGRRRLRTSKALNLCAPSTSLTDEGDAYDKSSLLDLAVKQAVYEVALYITEGKGEVEQMVMDFDNADDPFAEAQPTEKVEIA